MAFYFLMIRPQQRRKQQAAQKQNTVQPGARVRTTAGMYATVVDVDGDDVVLEVAPGVEVRYMKRAIMDVVSPGERARGDGDGLRRRPTPTTPTPTTTTPTTDTDTDTDVNPDAEWETFESDDVAETGSTTRQHQHDWQHHQGLAAPAQATSTRQAISGTPKQKRLAPGPRAGWHWPR